MIIKNIRHHVGLGFPCLLIYSVCALSATYKLHTAHLVTLVVTDLCSGCATAGSFAGSPLLALSVT